MRWRTGSRTGALRSSDTRTRNARLSSPTSVWSSPHTSYSLHPKPFTLQPLPYTPNLNTQTLTPTPQTPRLLLSRDGSVSLALSLSQTRSLSPFLSLPPSRPERSNQHGSAETYHRTVIAPRVCVWMHPTIHPGIQPLNPQLYALSPTPQTPHPNVNSNPDPNSPPEPHTTTQVCTISHRNFQGGAHATPIPRT